MLDVGGVFRSRERMAVVVAGFLLMGLSAAFSLGVIPTHLLVDLQHPTDQLGIMLAQGTASGLASGFLFSGIFIALCGLFTLPLRKSIERILTISAGTFLCFASLLAFVLRVAWIYAVPTSPISDSLWYHNSALGLAHGLGYVNTEGVQTAYWPIGYPLFLSLMYRIFPDQLMAKGSDLVLSLGIIILSYVLIRKRADEKPARILVLLLTVSVAEIVYVDALFSEILFTVLMLVGIIFYLDTLERASLVSAVVAGAVTGAAMLVRPIAALFPVIFMVILYRLNWKWTKKLQLLSAICAMVVLILAPNIVRNYNIFHRFVPVSTNGGINFWIGNNPASNGGYGTPPELPVSGERDLDYVGYTQGLDWIAHHPVRAFENGFKKFAKLWLHEDEGVLFDYKSTHGDASWGLEVTALIVGNLFYLGMLALAGLQAWKRRRSYTLMEQFFLALLTAWTFFHLVYFGLDRFHLPMLPIIFYFAAQVISNYVAVASKGLVQSERVRHLR